MNNKIIYLPLDERPCNYIYPQYIARIGGAEIVCAPINIMGRFKKPADVDTLWAWLFDNVKSASHVVLSTDLMLYGGIVPSRLHKLSSEICKNRLLLIEKLRAENPSVKIYAFGLITRAPAYSSSDEEPDYYENYGLEINRYGVLSDKETLGLLSKEEQEELIKLKVKIPIEYLSDFISRRETNFKSHLRLIELCSDNTLDALVIPLDDCKPYGYASNERRRLAAYAAEKGVLSKVMMYPGADEIGCVLTARAVCDINKNCPRIYLDWSSNTGMLTIPSYEDRTIGETAPYHILSGGATQAFGAESSDVGLFINPPTEFSSKLEALDDRREILMETERNIPAFLQRAQILMQSGIPCFIADCAVPNGAESSLMTFLKELRLLQCFSGYSGWNTSSNALGTAAAHAIAYASAKMAGCLGKEQLAESEKFRLMRYVEDWGYMTNVRGALTKRLSEFGDGLSYFTLCDKNDVVSQEAEKMLNSFIEKNLSEFKCKASVNFPWNRMFEIDIEVM